MEWKDRQTGAFMHGCVWKMSMGQEQNAINQADVLVQGTQKQDETSTAKQHIWVQQIRVAAGTILQAGRAPLVLFQSVDSTWHIDVAKEMISWWSRSTEMIPVLPNIVVQIYWIFYLHLFTMLPACAISALPPELSSRSCNNGRRIVIAVDWLPKCFYFVAKECKTWTSATGVQGFLICCTSWLKTWQPLAICSNWLILVSDVARHWPEPSSCGDGMTTTSSTSPAPEGFWVALWECACKRIYSTSTWNNIEVPCWLKKARVGWLIEGWHAFTFGPLIIEANDTNQRHQPGSLGFFVLLRSALFSAFLTAIFLAAWK